MATSKFIAAALLLSTTSARAGFDPEILFHHCQDLLAPRSGHGGWEDERKASVMLLSHSFTIGYLTAVEDKLDICLPEDFSGRDQCSVYVNYILENGMGGSSAYDLAEKALLDAFPCKEGK